MNFINLSIGDVVVLSETTTFTITTAPALQDDLVNYLAYGTLEDSERSVKDCPMYGIESTVVEVQPS